MCVDTPSLYKYVGAVVPKLLSGIMTSPEFLGGLSLLSASLSDLTRSRKGGASLSGLPPLFYVGDFLI